MRLKKEEKEFIKAWAGLYKAPLDTTVVKGMDGHINFGNHSWFWLAGKFNGLKEGKTYTIEELIK